jgi:hypothetical protein
MNDKFFRNKEFLSYYQNKKPIVNMLLSVLD